MSRRLEQWQPAVVVRVSARSAALVPPRGPASAPAVPKPPPELARPLEALAQRLRANDSSSFRTPARAELDALTRTGLDRASLEAMALTQELIDPFAAITRLVQNAKPPPRSWQELAPAQCAKLSRVIDAYRPLLKTPHLRASLDFLEQAMAAKGPKDWDRLEGVAGAQNSQLRADAGKFKLLTCFFWEDSNMCWPALHLVSKPGGESAGLDDDIGRLAGFFRKKAPAAPRPAILWADALLSAPPEGQAQAFALHDQAAVLFKNHDRARARFTRRLDESVGVSPETSRELGLRLLVGHELGHKVDPLNLPPITEELFADVAALAAVSKVLGSEVGPKVLLQSFVAFMLENYGIVPDDPPSRNDQLYFHSAGKILEQLSKLGVLEIDLEKEPPCRVKGSREELAGAVAHFQGLFEQLRRGECPKELVRSVRSEPIRALHEQLLGAKRRLLEPH